MVQAAAADLSAETASRQRQWICRHRQRQWVCCSRAGECGAGGGSRSVDRDGVKAAAVDLSTQSVSVGVVESSRREWRNRQAAVLDLSTQSASVGVVESSWRVWCGCAAVELASAVRVAFMDLSTKTASSWRRWICRHSRRQWVWCSRAGDCGEGGGGGSVDRDGVKAAAVDLSLQSASVGVVQSSW